MHIRLRILYRPAIDVFCFLFPTSAYATPLQRLFSFYYNRLSILCVIINQGLCFLHVIDFFMLILGAEIDCRRVLSVSKHNFFLLISVKRIVGFQICRIIHVCVKSLINLKKFWWVIACAPRDDWYITGLPLYFRGHIINSEIVLSTLLKISHKASSAVSLVDGGGKICKTFCMHTFCSWIRKLWYHFYPYAISRFKKISILYVRKL